MGLVSLLQKQVESRAQVICEQRNKSLPAELGKASYDVTDNGVIFIKQHFLLDSAHCDYMMPVAKVQWNQERRSWLLFMPDELNEENWLPYPYLAQSHDLTAIMREVDKDPKSVFWQD
ncbi:DUF3024 domain-containing protein [Vibrio sp. Isolate25]|uniref:DUF3024 domain-containing protein n=1 Tax=unclassified Vibrio TaxID=2614977 RepID=UPI001EFD946C|nr:MULTISPECIES: DUF3024 domain-containing protein [unclassified Vibrio]MCG9595977.1 DUF3024 domain-containing protein [Vibrio sp. Isolate25]MCG9677475.1 DUF3024 domain-containing protein [Vibrio sp. Isolate24]MCG9682098.1 DUF3024 domain-containing protein [Vibrio sp. Isolate23]